MADVDGVLEVCAWRCSARRVERDAREAKRGMFLPGCIPQGRRLGYSYFSPFHHYESAAEVGRRDHVAAPRMIPAMRAGRGGPDGRSDSHCPLFQGDHSR
jgi:hypothetical protein